MRWAVPSKRTFSSLKTNFSARTVSPQASCWANSTLAQLPTLQCAGDLRHCACATPVVWIAGPIPAEPQRQSHVKLSLTVLFTYTGTQRDRQQHDEPDTVRGDKQDHHETDSSIPAQENIPALSLASCWSRSARITDEKKPKSLKK